MRSSLYCTGDTIGSAGGGGQVTYHELEALREIANVELILQAPDVVHVAYVRQGKDVTLLHDYFAFNQVSSYQGRFDLAHFYSGGFPMTVRWLKAKGVAVTYTCPAHHRERSIEEAMHVAGSYPDPVLADDSLFELHNQCLHEADMVIVPSQASASYLDLQGVRNLSIIPHGTALPETVAPYAASFRVGYLGQIGPDKGLAYLLQAWGLLGYADADLILAGERTRELIPVIRRLADKGSFVLAGYIGQPSDLYNTVNVYVQPSVTESFGIEVLEAMSHGRPVVVSEGAGASDVVTNGVDGYIVPIRDPGAIAERLEHLYNHQDTIPEMGRRARETAGKYTWEKVQAMYREVWEKL